MGWHLRQPYPKDMCAGPLADLGPDPGPTHLTRLGLPGDYDRVEGVTGCIKNVKYLLRVKDREPPAPLSQECIFQNTRRFAYHLLFLIHFPELADLDLQGYLDLVMREVTRVWWGGSLQRWPRILHPETGESGVITYTVYQAEHSPPLTVATLIEVDQQIKGCVPYAVRRLVLAPSDLDQRSPFPGDQERACRQWSPRGGFLAAFPEKALVE